MPRDRNESVADYLVRRKFGRLEVHSAQRIAQMRAKGSPHADSLDRQDEPLRGYRAELRDKGKEELARLETEENAKEEHELFGWVADFDHWSKMADWTLDQAIALSFGRAPERVNWTTVAPHVAWSRFAFEYSRVRDRALSFVRWDQLYDPVFPMLFLAWAKRDGFPVEPELIRRVEARGLVVADWKDMYEKTRTERDRAVANLAIANRRLVEMTASAQTASQQSSNGVRSPEESVTDELSPGERKTLLKLGAYLARRFEFDQTSVRSEAIGKIRNELQRVGISLDEKTVRKLVREGSERFPKGEASS